MADPARRILGALSGIVLVRVLGITLIITGFLAYAQSLGASSLQAGLAFGAYPLALALFLAPVGHWSDRWGRRPIMLAGLALAAGGALLAALAPTWWLLALGRFVSGVGAVNGVALALAGEVGAPESRTRRFAVLGAAAGGGVVLGLVAGAALEPLVGVRGLLWGFAALNVLALPLAFVLPAGASGPTGQRAEGPTGTGRGARTTDGDVGPSTPVPSSVPVDPSSPRGPLALLSAAAFCVNLSLTVLLLLLRGTLGLSGWAFTWALLAMLVPGGLGMFAASRLADRGRAREVGIAAGIVLGLAPLAILAGGGLLLAIAGGVLFFLAHSSLSSLLPSLLVDASAAGRRGGAQGVQSTLQYLGSFAGSAVGGALAGMLLPLAVVFVAAGMVAAGSVALVAGRPSST